MNHTETNEDWVERLKAICVEIDCSMTETNRVERELISIIRSLRQSDKELILGKMVYKIPTKHDRCTLDDNYCYNHQEIMKDDDVPNGAYDYNKALDTCKSIVEEVMK